MIEPGGDSSEFSTEAVIYKATNDTAEAFAEIAKAASHCSGGVTPASIGSSWPKVQGVQLLGYSTSTPIPFGQAVNTTVYLRRGSVLLGLYLNSTSPTLLGFAVAGSTSIETIIRSFESGWLLFPPRRSPEHVAHWIFMLASASKRMIRVITEHARPARGRTTLRGTSSDAVRPGHRCSFDELP